MLKELLFFNITTIFILLNKGFKEFKDFISNINKDYLEIKMKSNKINKIKII